MPTKVQRMLLCPHCSSPDVFYEMGGITGIIYHCKKCDYIGPLIIEQEFEFEEGLEKKEAEQKKRRWFKRT